MNYLSWSPILKFKKSVTLENSDNNIVLKTTYNTLNIQELSPGLIAVFQLLCGRGATEDELSDVVFKTDGFSQLPRFYHYLQNFTDLKIINYTVCAEESPLIEIEPITSDSPFEFSAVVNNQLHVSKRVLNQKYVLSRFCYCRKGENHLILESSLSHFKIIMLDWRGLAIISELSQPKSTDELLVKIPTLSGDSINLFIQLLLDTKMICEVGTDGKISEIEDEALSQWEFHDLLFHTRSRVGRNINPLTLKYRFLGQINPLPVVKPQMSNYVIDLYKPDLEELKRVDTPFTQVLENRKSIRSHGEKAITDQQLGEFLYRSARIRNIFKTEQEELSNRPYPTMGACYELEIYVAINRCEQIASGLYHYEPLEHQLGKISDKNKAVKEILHYAWLHAHGYYAYDHLSPTHPQILIIITARFQRVSWAYESLAYAQILKNVGVLFQTMYLVATAMQLSSCAQSGGNSDLFAKMIRTDYYAETSVGEFILGSQPSI